MERLVVCVVPGQVVQEGCGASLAPARGPTVQLALLQQELLAHQGAATALAAGGGGCWFMFSMSHI